MKFSATSGNAARNFTQLLGLFPKGNLFKMLVLGELSSLLTSGHFTIQVEIILMPKKIYFSSLKYQMNKRWKNWIQTSCNILGLHRVCQLESMDLVTILNQTRNLTSEVLWMSFIQVCILA